MSFMTGHTNTDLYLWEIIKEVLKCYNLITCMSGTHLGHVSELYQSCMELSRRCIVLLSCRSFLSAVFC